MDTLHSRLDRMVATGRVTPEEASRVRTAATGDDRAAAIAAIQLRHARERLASAVAGGRLTTAEADAALRHAEECGDLSSVRRLLARTSGHGSPGDAT